MPKFLVNENGEPVQSNQVSVGSIEKKMGIKASPTCVMNYDNAKGWLIGNENEGLACMFTMMNDARFQVGLQGLGACEASFQGALAYAKERLQSRSPSGPELPDRKADPIIFQPDIYKMLMTQKALTEGCRALSTLYAQQMDLEHHGTGEPKLKAFSVVAFLTPICKSFFTDIATEVTNIGVQVYGGHGYIREWGMEQLVRDCRIAQLYEGTNGIQAQDLIGRKLTQDHGKTMRTTYQWLKTRTLGIQCSLSSSNANYLLDEWLSLSEGVLKLSTKEISNIATEYLHYTSYVLLGVVWIDLAYHAGLSPNKKISSAKRLTCEFYFSNIISRKEVFKSTIGTIINNPLKIDLTVFE